jgi:hypothetical protein
MTNRELADLATLSEPGALCSPMVVRWNYLPRTEVTMSPRTIFLSKLLGLYCIILALAMLVNGTVIMQDVTELAHNAPVMFIAGVFTLFAGLAMVLGHNYWRGGAVTIVVTLIGWLTLLKAVLILFIPLYVATLLPLALLQSHHFFYVRLVVTLLLGVYLTYSGFGTSAKTQQPV